MSQHNLYQGDCLEVLPWLGSAQCVFADPPDNIGLGYDEFTDRQSDSQYIGFLDSLIWASTTKAPIVWISFNAKWTFAMGKLFDRYLGAFPEWEGKPCVQAFTFGQHNKNDLGNNHRPLWRLKHKDAPLYPENIKVPSWRQRNGDKRAAPGGRVPGDVFDMQYPLDQVEGADDLYDAGYPTRMVSALMHADTELGYIAGNVEIGNEVEPLVLDRIEKIKGVKREIDRAIKSWSIGDVFDFPRVTGNSKQRCDWHPTQLHEELVERVIKLSTKEGDHVIDPFGGTGTTLRVSKRLNRRCTLIELDNGYCSKIAEGNGMTFDQGAWEC